MLCVRARYSPQWRTAIFKHAVSATRRLQCYIILCGAHGVPIVHDPNYRGRLHEHVSNPRQEWLLFPPTSVSSIARGGSCVPPIAFNALNLFITQDITHASGTGPQPLCDELTRASLVEEGNNDSVSCGISVVELIKMQYHLDFHSNAIILIYLS